MELTDGVIVLRTPTVADAQDVADGVLASIDHLSRFMPWATGDYSLDSALAWINGDIDPAGHRFLIIDPDGRVAGSAGVNRIDTVNDVADVGYWLRSEATGKGYATRAANLLLTYAIEEMGLHRVEIILAVENEASRRVAERTPARYEGVLRGALKLPDGYHDIHMYALLATD